jgi:hypothetical protein
MQSTQHSTVTDIALHISNYYINITTELSKIVGLVISGKSMRVRPESVTHLVVKLFNVKSKFDYIYKNKQKSEIANNDKFEKRNENRRTYRTVGQKLTRSDLNFSRQTRCPEQFFSNLGPTKCLKMTGIIT